MPVQASALTPEVAEAVKAWLAGYAALDPPPDGVDEVQYVMNTLHATPPPFPDLATYSYAMTRKLIAWARAQP